MPTDTPEISLNGWNAAYIDELYRQWRSDPATVDPDWHRFFEGFDLAARIVAEDGEDGGSTLRVAASDSERRAAAMPDAEHRTTGKPGPERRAASAVDVAHTKQGRVDSLIYHYRDIGHLAAEIDPLGFERPFPEQLTLASFDLSDEDLEEAFDPGHLPLDNPCRLSTIIQCLEDTYCRHVGVEYMHIQDRDQRRWLQKRMETVRNAPTFEAEHRKRILAALRHATGLESFLDTRYKGKKWFSLSGGESLIPIMAEIIEYGPANGVLEFTCGMAHRGRVNVLVNILGKSYQELFTEFHESWEEDYIEGGGDVKYHRGYSSDYTTVGGQTVHLTMASNPSHLEFVYPVVLGRCRAKQRLKQNESQRDKVVPILIHGDASFPAQGVVAECLNMVRLGGYSVGGAIHIVVNNQVGFTTDVADARSGTYCTDIAKMIGAPIFHVNGDDPEACAFVARLALEYRQAFKNDIVIDLYCFRKYGHNESDEPAFTQPLMYERVAKKAPVMEIYAERLQADGIISAGESERLREELKERLDSAQEQAKEAPVDPTPDPFRAIWEGLTGHYSHESGGTAVKRETLIDISRSLGRTPRGFNIHRKLKKLVETRGGAVEGDADLDWAMGELLAYGSLVLEGHAVRLTGQDVERGTFSHRHAVLFDQKTGEPYTPLNHIRDGQAKFCVHNSPLSEASCVGYEYGYSLADPKMLIIWEAQFGDFANGAQVIIDQFIASAEIKWGRHSGLVLLLPHAYEGQGPEHSSARLERFLMLCADENMQVIYPTTPAQVFHALRRQLKVNYRKPLIVMSPKSLLRHREATSKPTELVDGSFQFVIDDATIKRPRSVRRIVFCSGKVYYDLHAKRTEDSVKDVAIVRIEQLYPFPHEQIEDVLARYENADEIAYVQEEPMNAGAFRYVEPIFREDYDLDMVYVGREASATPAVGSSRVHAQEQAEILEAAFAPFEDVEESEEEVSESSATKEVAV